MNAVYLPFLVRDLKDFLGAVGPLGIRGFSVTHSAQRDASCAISTAATRSRRKSAP